MCVYEWVDGVVCAWTHMPIWDWGLFQKREIKVRYFLNLHAATLYNAKQIGCMIYKTVNIHFINFIGLPEGNQNDQVRM